MLGMRNSTQFEYLGSYYQYRCLFEKTPGLKNKDYYDIIQIVGANFKKSDENVLWGYKFITYSHGNIL